MVVIHLFAITVFLSLHSHYTALLLHPSSTNWRSNELGVSSNAHPAAVACTVKLHRNVNHFSLLYFRCFRDVFPSHRPSSGVGSRFPLGEPKKNCCTINIASWYEAWQQTGQVAPVIPAQQGQQRRVILLCRYHNNEDDVGIMKVSTMAVEKGIKGYVTRFVFLGR